MKTQNKKLCWCILLVLLLPILLLPLTTPRALAEELPETVTITLHKRIHDENEVLTAVKNTGELRPVLDTDEWRGLNDVQFAIYDVTAELAAYRKAHPTKSSDDAYGDFADEVDVTTLTELSLTIPKTSTVGGEDGVTSFTLPNSGSYLIVETDAPAEVHSPGGMYARNMILSLPFYGTGTTSLAEIHLYPKNEQYVRDPYFFKFAKTAADTEVGPLAEAVFVLYRETTNGKEYLQDINQTGTKWGSLAEASRFTSDKDGLVTTGNHELTSGTYYFEEIAAPDGYHITDALKKIEVTIPDEKSEPVLINGSAMTDKVKVFNYGDPELDKEITDGKHDFAYGEWINYRVTTMIPADIGDAIYTKFTLTDLADAGLKLDESSIKVEIAGGDSNLYQLTTHENGYTVDFDVNLLSDFPGKQVTVTYRAMIREGTEADLDIENTVILDLGHKTLTDKEFVITGGKRFLKVDRADIAKTLAGAQFVVRNANGEYLTSSNAGYAWINIADATFEDDYRELGLVTLTSAADGSFLIKGLHYGAYQLREIAAPSGYRLLTTMIDFQVAANSYDTVIGVTRSPSSPLQVVNEATGGTLPGTGGKTTTKGILPGTGEKVTLISLLGLSLIILAGGAYVKKWRHG